MPVIQHGLRLQKQGLVLPHFLCDKLMQGEAALIKFLVGWHAANLT